MGRHKSTKNPLRVMLAMCQIQTQEESESEYLYSAKKPE